MKPSQVNSENFLSVEQAINNQIMSPLIKLENNKFNFSTGELLLIKARALTFPVKLGLKRSIKGCNSDVKAIVLDQEIRVTGRGSKFLTPYYKLEKKGWF